MVLSSSLAERAPSTAGAFGLRRLTIADAETAAAVIRDAFAAQSRATHPPSSALRETAATVAAKIEAGGGFGLHDRGRLVAVALWQASADALHVGRVSALPSFRGRGAVRGLMAACEGEARTLGAARMTLKVRLELPENERLFERFGFRRVSVEAHEGFDAPTTAVMEKRL